MGRPSKATPEKMAAFCAAVATAGGNITRGCEAIDVNRMTVYRWRDEDPEFAAAWDEAKRIGIEGLEDEAMRRAFEGTEKPVFHLGMQCGTIREYSDTLTIFLLKGAKPEKYRDNAKLDLTSSDGSMSPAATDTEVAARAAALLAQAAQRDGEDLV